MSIQVIEAALVARLAARLKPALVLEVYGQREYASVQETAMVTPSVAVIYTGYTPTQPLPGNPAIQNVGFGWLVVVNVRNARAPDTGQGVRDEASPILDAVLEAVLGLKPSSSHSPMKLEAAPGAALTDAGFGYYPLAFSTQKTYRGTN